MNYMGWVDIFWIVAGGGVVLVCNWDQEDLVVARRDLRRAIRWVVGRVSGFVANW